MDLLSNSDAKLSFGEHVAALAITGVLTAVSAITATGFANAGQIENTKEQLRLSEQQASYTAFVGAAEDLLRAQRNASILFEPRSAPPTQTEGQSRIDALGDVNVKLQTAAARVVAVWPDEVDGKTIAIVKKMEAISAVYFVGFNKLNPTPGPEVLAAVKADGDPLFTDYYALKEEFLKSSSKLLGT